MTPWKPRKKRYRVYWFDERLQATVTKLYVSRAWAERAAKRLGGAVEKV